MFTVLHEIIKILTHRMREVPTRLEKEKMKEFAQLDERYTVSCDPVPNEVGKGRQETCTCGNGSSYCVVHRWLV